MASPLVAQSSRASEAEAPQRSHELRPARPRASRHGAAAQRRGGARRARQGEPPIPVYTGIYKLCQQARATLGVVGLRESVALPPGVEKGQWVASQLLGIYEELQHVVAAVENICECPEMEIGTTKTGEKYVCKWVEGPGRAAECCTARDYMDKLLAHVHEQLSNRDVFPIDDGVPFPEESARVAKQLSRRMFRIYAHAYLSHFERIQEERLEAELNFCYKHFLYFVKEFDLVCDQELLPLHELNRRWLALPPSGPEHVPAELRGLAAEPAGARG